jgi:DNA mismatch repair protein MutL
MVVLLKILRVSNAIIHGYGSKLMIGRFPMGVININTDPLLIDVNVHPQKSEIRLSKETELSELLVQTIKARLADENLIPDAYENLYGKTKKTEYKVVQPTQIAPWLNTDLATVRQPDSEANTNTGSDITGISITKRSQLLARDVSTFVTKYENEATLSVFDTLETEQVTESVATYQSPFTDIAVKSQETLDVTPQRTSGFPDLSYIGQMHGTFLFAQTEDGLFLIDQHAAQERINYEYYRQKIGEVSDDKQRLLVPITINYTASDMLKIADHEQDLLHVGLTVVPFGPTSVIIREHPTWFENGQEEATIREMIDWILRDGALTVRNLEKKQQL